MATHQWVLAKGVMPVAWRAVDTAAVRDWDVKLKRDVGQMIASVSM